MISDPWTPRSKPEREYRTSKADRDASKIQRDALRDAARCINGPAVGNVGRTGIVHGEVYKGGRCRRCYDVKTGGAS